MSISVTLGKCPFFLVVGIILFCVLNLMTIISFPHIYRRSGTMRRNSCFTEEKYLNIEKLKYYGKKTLQNIK